MTYDFNQEDIGRRVSLVLNPEKLEEEFKVPYAAIIDYSFPIVNISSKPREIVNTSLKQRKINFVSVAQDLGASSMTLDGYINQVTNDYLIINPMKNK